MKNGHIRGGRVAVRQAFNNEDIREWNFVHLQAGSGFICIYNRSDRDNGQARLWNRLPIGRTISNHIIRGWLCRIQ
jgi:hypothetical protein